MSYKINFEKYCNNIILPIEIVNVDLEKIDSDFLKVALLIFKDSNITYEIESISDKLNISQKKVREALDYWSNLNVLKLKKEATKVVNKEIKQDKSQVENNKIENNIVDVNILKPQNTKVTKAPNVMNDEVVFLLDAIQNMFKHTISKPYHEVVTYVVTELKLPTDVILLAFHYCNETMKNFNIKYFQKLCTSWAEMEINTSERADKYLLQLKQSSPEEDKVKELFKIDRLLLPKEKEYIRVWTKDYGYNTDIISCAGELTYSKTNNYALAYMNTILADWYAKCFTDVTQVQHLLPENKRVNIVRNNTSNNTSNNKSYDLEEAQRMWNNDVPSLI